MPIDALLMLVSRGPVLDFVHVDMSAMTRCRWEGSYRVCRDFSCFIVTGVSIFSKLSRDATAASSAWHTHVNNRRNALTA